MPESEKGPQGPINPRPPDPDPPPDLSSGTSSTINNNQAAMSGEQDTVSQGRGYAAAAAPKSKEKKWINIHMFKSEKSTKLQMTEEEHAKIINKLNINPKQLHAIDDHLKTTLFIQIDADVDMSTLALHEAITVRRGLRTKPLRKHSHLEYIKIYKTSVRDNDEDIKAMLSTFGEVLSISHMTYQAKKDSSEALKAIAGVKKGDREVTMRLHSFLPTFGLLESEQGVRKVKFSRSNAIKTCVRCGMRERKLDEEDDLQPCPGEGDPKKCEEANPSEPPLIETVWEFWKSRAGVADSNPGQQVFAEIKAKTIEVFNVNVQSTKEDLKAWFQTFEIIVPLADIHVDENPRKKIVKNITRENMMKIMEIDGFHMTFKDGSKTRLFMTALRDEPTCTCCPATESAAQGSGSGPPPPPPPNHQQQQHTHQPPPNHSHPPATQQPPPPPPNTQLPPPPNTQPPNTQPPKTQRKSRPSATSSPAKSTPPVSSQNQQPLSMVDHMQILLQNANSTSSSTDDSEVNRQIFQAMKDLLPVETSTAKHPLQLPGVLPNDISMIEEGTAEMDLDEDPEEPSTPDSFSYAEVPSLKEISEKVLKDRMDATSTSHLHNNSYLNATETPPPGLRPIGSESTTPSSTSSSPGAVIRKVLGFDPDSLPESPPAAMRVITSPASTVSTVPNSPASPSSSVTPTPDTEVQSSPETTKSPTSPPSSSPRSPSPGRPLRDSSSGDSAYAASQGSSIDLSLSRTASPGTILPQKNLKPGDKGRTDFLIPAVETNSTAGDINSNNESDTFVDINDISVSTISDGDSTLCDELDVTMREDDDDNNTLNNTVVEVQTKIPKLKQIAIKAVTNLPPKIKEFLKESNSSDWGKYLHCVDIERRAWELQRKLDDPSCAEQVDQERRRNERIQEQYNPDGHRYGFIWCGTKTRRNSISVPREVNLEEEVSPRSRTQDDIPDTPKTRKRLAQFSSPDTSPEEWRTANRTKNKSAKKKLKQLQVETADTIVRNFYSVLDTIQNEVDVHPEAIDDKDDEIYGPIIRNPLHITTLDEDGNSNDIEEGEIVTIKDDEEENKEMINQEQPETVLMSTGSTVSSNVMSISDTNPAEDEPMEITEETGASLQNPGDDDISLL